MAQTVLFERVLLVEDDSSHALLIKRALRELVHQVEHAVSVQAAFALLDSFQPDLVVTDLNLPDSQSLEHVRRFNQSAPELPVVVLTSSSSLQDAVEAMKLGAKDFIVKNFDSGFKDALSLSLSRLCSGLALEREKRRLLREMGVLKIAIEDSQDGLAVSNAAGLVQYSNSAFRNFVNLCQGNDQNLLHMLGSGVSKADALREGLLKNLNELPSGAVWNTELTIVEKKDLAFSLSLSAVSSQHPESGTPIRDCVIWVKDISEQKRREKFQREILSTTTHDLKGPLGAIMISAELITDMVKDRPRINEIALRIGSAAQGAVNLIDEFLSARRIQEGTFILKPSKHEMLSLIREVVGNYQAIAAARNIDIELVCPTTELHWFIDKLGFARVLGNLLSNALKFTDKSGKIKVELKTSPNELHLGVSDTGCGMEPSEVKKIFERFSRLDKHSAVAGSGLGLFVLKSIVEAHGGNIQVTSSPGNGTTFDLTFPEKPPVNERGELISLAFA